MKRRFLPISLLLTIIVLAQTSIVANAHGDNGEYTPRSTTQATVQSFMKSIRANQETGLVDPAWLVENSTMSKSRGELDWRSLGPDNYGSFTKAIAFDKKDATNKTIYIGTMGGGVFRSVNGGITWKSVSGNMMVTTMVQTEDGTIYVGTGDGRDVHIQNGLIDLNYSTGFIGDGVYKSTDNGNRFEKISATADWKFVNELAAYGNTIYAATSEGLFKSTDGENWGEPIIEGVAYSVKTNSTGIVVAHVDKDVYKYYPESGKLAVLTDGKMLPSNADHKVLATSPSDPDYVYVAYLTKKSQATNKYTNDYETGNIYVTKNFTQEVEVDSLGVEHETMTWDIAFNKTKLYEVFGSNSFVDNAIAVYPNNPKKLLLGGSNVWVLEDSDNTGIYRAVQISSSNGFQIINSGGAYAYNYSYVHGGVQNIVFNPGNPNVFFVGTEGGIHKGEYASGSYAFEGMNRYLIDENNHTSVTRMFSVGFSGNNTVIGGSLDHGTIKVIADPTLNNVSTGNAIFPNDQTHTDASATYGSFNYTMAGGPCAISTIKSTAMFVTKTGGYNASGSITVPVMRTQTSGDDYDKENFTYSASEDTPEYLFAPYEAFRVPFAFQEHYNDVLAIDSVMFYADKTYYKGDSIKAFSLNSDYPFYHILAADSLVENDSIMVQDIISSTMIVPARSSSSVSEKASLYLTRDALKFNKKAEWWKIATLRSNPNVITLSQDGDVAFVGTVDGKLYKYSNITEARNALETEGFAGVKDKYEYIYDSVPDTSKPWDTTYTYITEILDSIVNGDTVIMEIFYDTIMDIDTIWKKTKDIVDSIFVQGEEPIPSLINSAELDATAFNGQAITSIAINPKDNDEVLVTLGNYGNDNYVFYSEDGGNTFSSIQGDLPKIPVYSGIIEKGSGNIIIGTEEGIYSTDNNSNWTLNGLENIPVMDLKQQIQKNHNDEYKYLVDEIGEITTITYPGVFNEGAIFAATYGRGLFRCDEYLVTNDYGDVNVEENFTNTTLGVNIYPNPIVNNATIEFDMIETAKVTYQVYDLSGRLVSNVTLGTYAEGTHNVNFNVDNLNSGTYIIRVQAGKMSKTSKILVY